MNKLQNRFVLLDGMRGFAALGVVAFHVMVITKYRQLDSLYLLVDFFFVLSGFVLMPSMPGNVRTFPKDAVIFIFKRILRFWPMLTAVLIVTWIAYQFDQQTYAAKPDPNLSEEMFIKAFLLLQIWVSATIAMNWPLWSLSAEWFANLIFTPLTVFKNIGIWIGIIAGYYALWHGLNTDQEFIGDSWSTGNGPIRGWEALGRAMLGFGIGLLIRKHLDSLQKLRNHWLFILSLFMGYLLFKSHMHFQGETVYFTTYISAPIFAFIVLQASQYNPSPKKILGKLLSFFGKISFGVYAYHVVVLINFDLFIDQPFNTNRLAKTRVWEYFTYNFSVVAGLSIVLAILTIFFVEKPINTVFKKALKKYS